MKQWTRGILAGGVCVALGLVLALKASGADEAKPKKDAAVERTRKQVKMLDDLYKTAVVLVTQHYVTETSDLPAGSAAKALFAEMKKKGHHDVRLIDIAGEPINDENNPQDDFEKAGVASLKKGEGWHEAIEKDAKGKRYLRAMTPVPVVLEKCIMCHENYRKVEKGAPIGALGYRIAIE